MAQQLKQRVEIVEEVEQPSISCGYGHCYLCQCTGFSPRAEGSNQCVCVHSFSQHEASRLVIILSVQYMPTVVNGHGACQSPVCNCSGFQQDPISDSLGMCVCGHTYSWHAKVF